MVTSFTIDDSPEAAAETVRLVQQIRAVEKQAQAPVPSEHDAIQVRPQSSAARSLTIDFATGQTVEEKTAVPRQVTQDDLRAQTGSILDTATARGGKPLTRSELTPDSLVSYGGMQATLRTLEMLGVVEIGPSGQYQEVGQQPALQLQPQRPVSQEQPAAQAETGELAEADEVLSTLMQNDGELAGGILNSTIEALVSGEAVNLDAVRLASALNMDNPLAAHGAASAAFDAYQKMAEDAVRGAGVEDVEGFYEWVRGERASAMREALRKQLWNRDVGGWSTLARDFAGRGLDYHDDDILGADFGDGITSARGADGRAKLIIPGVGEVDAKAAIRRGMVKVRRQ